jgi:hypothetical protein
MDTILYVSYSKKDGKRGRLDYFFLQYGSSRGAATVGPVIRWSVLLKRLFFFAFRRGMAVAVQNSSSLLVAGEKQRVHAEHTTTVNRKIRDGRYNCTFSNISLPVTRG